MKYYIYILSNPSSGDIFYVGCTSNYKNRASQHKYNAAKKLFEYKSATPKDIYILQMQRDPIFHVIEEVVGFKEVAIIREKFWITFLSSNGFPLVNHVGKNTQIVLKSELYGLPKKFESFEVSEVLEEIRTKAA